MAFEDQVSVRQKNSSLMDWSNSIKAYENTDSTLSFVSAVSLVSDIMDMVWVFPHYHIVIYLSQSFEHLYLWTF